MHDKLDVTDLSDADVSRIVHALFVRLVEVLEELRSPEVITRTPVRLTTREYEVVRCVLAGATNKELAKVLNMSPRTAEQHRARAMEKIGAVSHTHLIRTLVELGVPPDPRVALTRSVGRLSLSDFLPLSGSPPKRGGK